MNSVIRLGARPVGEPARNNCTTLRECQVYLAQLIRHFGEPPPAARIEIDLSQTEPCVVCRYNDDVIIATYYAYLCEMKASRMWDNVSLGELMCDST